jgi:hypothetical protein
VDETFSTVPPGPKKGIPMSKAHSATHPSAAYEGSPLWKVASKAIAELVKNGDLVEIAEHPYVVGYICRKVSEAKELKAKS